MKPMMCSVLKLRVTFDDRERPSLVGSGDTETYSEGEWRVWQEERCWCWWFRRSVSNRVDQQQYTRVEGCLFVFEFGDWYCDSLA